MADAARDHGARAPAAPAAAPCAFEVPPAFLLNDRGGGNGGGGVPQLIVHELCAHEEQLQFAAFSSMVISAHSDLVCAPDVPDGRSLGAHLKTAREGGVIIGHPFNKARDAATAKAMAMAKALSSRAPAPRVWTACAPKLPAGRTHHTKFLLLCYDRFLRVCLMSGNYFTPDWRDNTNSVFVQDFPRKAAPTGASEFEAALLRYCAELASQGLCDVAKLVRHLQVYDFSSAKVTLLVSAPGARSAAARMGHLGLRAALQEEAAAAAAAAAAQPQPPQPVAAAELVAQCSSYGSLAKFLPDFVASCAGITPPAAPATSKKRARGGAATVGAPLAAPLAASPLLRCMWPTVGAVRASARGWAGGSDFPTEAETLNEALSQRLLHPFAYADELRATKAAWCTASSCSPAALRCRRTTMAAQHHRSSGACRAALRWIGWSRARTTCRPRRGAARCTAMATARWTTTS
jgi:hypothetical protein